MRLDSLGAALETHKVPVLAAAGAAVAGLALARKRKAAAGAGATGSVATVTAPTATPYSAGGQAAGATGGASYDSTASDLYGVIQPQLEALGNQMTQLSANPPVRVPAPPLASTLTNPTGSGSYVHLADGTIAEVEADHSLFGLTPAQWSPLAANGAQFTANLPTTPDYFSTVRNLTPPIPIPAATPVAAAATK